jgi:hypothetical protein
MPMTSIAKGRLSTQDLIGFAGADWPTQASKLASAMFFSVTGPRSLTLRSCRANPFQACSDVDPSPIRSPGLPLVAPIHPGDLGGLNVPTCHCVWRTQVSGQQHSPSTAQLENVA